MSKWAALQCHAKDRWGLATLMSARREGVTGDVLVAAEARGNLKRLRYGLWAFVDEWYPHQEVAAHWLELSEAPADLEVRNSDVIVSHETAAEVRQLGKAVDFGRHRFTCSRPLSHDIPAIRTSCKVLASSDWSMVDGLPVVSPARIIADLLEVRADGDVIGSVVDDCLYQGLVDRHTVDSLATEHFTAWGYPDAGALVDGLLWSSHGPTE